MRRDAAASNNDTGSNASSAALQAMAGLLRNPGSFPRLEHTLRGPNAGTGIASSNASTFIVAS
jgi:hypothetical protein